MDLLANLSLTNCPLMATKKAPATTKAPTTDTEYPFPEE